MNTYKINFGGKQEIIKGPNLEGALRSHGFSGIRITPKWRGRSNGRYTATCHGNTIIQCEWIEKINRLENGL